MKDKPMALVFRPDEVDEFGAIINCAVRYCIGRESYMPKLVTDFLRKHPEMLDAKSISTMIRDIRLAKEEPITEWEARHGRTGLGLDYQHQMWLDFLSWLEKQEAKINEDNINNRTPGSVLPRGSGSR